MARLGGVAAAGRPGATRRDWTKGSIVGNLWTLAWPTLITSTLNVIGPTIDMIWVGKLGKDAIASVGVSGITVTVMQSLVMGIFTGTSAMVARSIGAKDEKSALRVAQQGFVIGGAFSIFMALIGIFFANTIMALLGVDPAIAPEGASYMRIQFIGMVTMTAVSLSQSIMQATGDTRTPMKMSVGYRLFQIGLCPMLVFGVMFFPKMGVNGAAWSNVIAQAFGGAFGLWCLFSGQTRLHVTMRGFRFDGNLIWRTVKIGVPSSLTNVQRSMTDMLTLRMVTPFGTLYVAAHSLMQRIDMFIQTPTAGLGTAAGVLAAQNLGAGEQKRAIRTGWMAALIATAISVFFSVLIWFWAEPMFRFFTPQPDVVGVASSFLRINIISYVVWGVVVALSMCLNGVGDTEVPMVTNLVSMVVIQLGLAFYLSRYTSLGVYGIRWAVVSGIVARGIIYTLYFHHGRWLHKKV